MLIEARAFTRGKCVGIKNSVSPRPVPLKEGLRLARKVRAVWE